MDEILPGQGGKVQDQGFDFKTIFVFGFKAYKVGCVTVTKTSQRIEFISDHVTNIFKWTGFGNKTRGIDESKKIACPSW